MTDFAPGTCHTRTRTGPLEPENCPNTPVPGTDLCLRHTPLSTTGPRAAICDPADIIRDRKPITVAEIATAVRNEADSGRFSKRQTIRLNTAADFIERDHEYRTAVIVIVGLAVAYLIGRHR